MADDLRKAADEFLVRYGGDRFDRLFVKAKGAVVVDDTGREILDFTSGQMCATIGHNHPAIVEAMAESGRNAIHMFSGMIPEVVVRLGRKLAEWLPAPLKKSLFVNTGSESNEAALRIAKLATGGYEVIAFGGSWHGVTGAAAGVSYASDRRGYGPDVPGAYAIPEPNAYRCPIGHCRDRCDQSCLNLGLRMFDMQSRGAPAAIIVEPILSAGGVIVPPEGFYKRVEDACAARGMLLVIDEAQTGLGKTGKLFGFQHEAGVTPDIIAISKHFGGGLPISAVCATAEVAERAVANGYFATRSHAGDPILCAAGEASLEVVVEEDMAGRARRIERRIKERMNELAKEIELIGDVRGRGVLLGIELVRDRVKKTPANDEAKRIAATCLEHGLIFQVRGVRDLANVIRLVPPMTTTDAEVERALAILEDALRAVAGGAIRRKSKVRAKADAKAAE